MAPLELVESVGPVYTRIYVERHLEGVKSWHGTHVGAIRILAEVAGS
jgi:hypothetical protein